MRSGARKGHPSPVAKGTMWEAGVAGEGLREEVRPELAPTPRRFNWVKCREVGKAPRARGQPAGMEPRAGGFRRVTLPSASRPIPGMLVAAASEVAGET